MAAPVDLFHRLAQQGVRLNGEPAGLDRALPLRIWKVEDGHLVLKLEVELDPDAVAAGAKLWCIFENMGRVRTFRSTIAEVVLRPDGRLAAWRVPVPDEVRSEDRRRAYRVPVIVGARVTLELGDQQWLVECRNLSVTGGLLRLPEAVADALPDHGRYMLAIETGEGDVRIGCRLARRAPGGRLAVTFPRTLKLGEVKPPPDLARVVRTLELRWLRRRSGRDAA